jgi:hypothetical protein
MKLKGLMAVVALMGTLAAGSANATLQWNLLYSSPAPSGPNVVDVILTTTDTANGAGGYTVLNASGFVDADAIIGVETNPNAGVPSYATSLNNKFNFDNFLFAGAMPYLSNNGVLLNGISGNQYNGFSVTPAGTQVANGNPSSPLQFLTSTHNLAGNWIYGASSTSNTFSLTAMVPEPHSWALMILGFGGVGAMIRRRRHPQVALA